MIPRNVMLVGLATAATLTAQAVPDPDLHVTASPTLDPPPVQINPVAADQVAIQVSAVAGATYLVAIDIDPGPVVLGDLRLRLGLTSSLAIVDAGVIPATGRSRRILDVPPMFQPIGRAFWFQGFVVRSGSGGVLRTTNGESSIVRLQRHAIVERFDAPGRAGFVGDFDRSAEDVLRGTITERTVRTADPAWLPFGRPVAGPLDERGARQHQVIRARELRADGRPEWVTAIRWRAWNGEVVAATYQRFDMDIAHTSVVPDYTIDPFTGLPSAPDSGLDETFSTNLAMAMDRIAVRRGPYTLDAGDLRPDGYVEYGIQVPFRYNGVDSLLIEFKTGINRPLQSVSGNGQVFVLPVVSSPQPFSRIIASSTRLPSQSTVDPDSVTVGGGDNAISDYQVVLVRNESVARSPFRDSGLASPAYGNPHLAAVTPAASRIELEFRGADNAAGTNPTAWSSNITNANGKPFVQYRVTLIGDPMTGDVPELDTLVLPVQ